MQVKESSIKLTVVQKPSQFTMTPGGSLFAMAGGPFQVTAKCEIRPDPPSPARPGAPPAPPAPPSAPATAVDPRSAPWKLGFLQAQVLEVAWAYYRSTEREGSCVLVDTAVRRQQTICRDYDRSKGVIWYECSSTVADCYGVPPATGQPPWSLEFYFGDDPKHDVHQRVMGPGQRYHHLYEARCSLAFVTTLTEQVSPGVLRHRRHFLWSAIWHYRRINEGPQWMNAPFQQLRSTGFWMSEVKNGGPTNADYNAVLMNPAMTASCNEIAQGTSPKRTEAGGWGRFTEMDAKDTLLG